MKLRIHQWVGSSRIGGGVGILLIYWRNWRCEKQVVMRRGCWVRWRKLRLEEVRETFAESDSGLKILIESYCT